MPLVSIFMAFHRVTPFFEGTVRSILAQTHDNFELLLVDDGTGAGLQPLGDLGRDARIKLIQFDRNRGIAAAHNACLSAARGEFIALHDYDDLSLPRRLELQVKALRENPGWGLVSGGVETIDQHGNVVGWEFCLNDPAQQRRYCEYSAPVVTPVFTGRREVFERFPYRAEFRFAADFDFLARASEAVQFGHVPEVLLQYRRHEAQTTQTRVIELTAERAVVRLLAARRRAGRIEGSNGAELVRSAMQQSRDESGIFTWFARRFLAEGFPVQAAYHARQSIRARRTPITIAGALGTYFHAISTPQRGLASRMFWRGPVRALDVTPWRLPVSH